MFRIRLKELRENNKISQQKLANIIGVSQSTVGMWENGTNKPEFNTLTKIADYFNVSIDYLIGNDTNKKSPSIKEELTADEQKLLKSFRELNEEGQYILLSQAEALTLSGQYIKTNSAKLAEA